MSLAPESNTRSRTRRAILDAAVSLLSKDATASLSDIAAEAGVGRTTVHRYFPERADLLKAISTDALEQIETMSTRARLDEGPAIDGLRRLCQEYFELGEVLNLLFNNPQLITNEEWTNPTEADHALDDLVKRGLADGEFADHVTPQWAVHVLWSLLYAGWSHVEQDGVSKHEALTRTIATLTNALKR
ncbi:TetR/AcrR family transcriptional regulator [Stackebrandtia endophytica]|uniref:TetR/AcrR family transcriptional regulator n=1 Tax=Stackebrandtia endophytica TaxID=1496996 RepID=UPI001B85DA49|nr:TetR/AcrR family transcriptional regulator [Stackebrandtia endophytica]